MIVRFFLISLLKWLLGIATIAVLYAYVIPSRITGILSVVPTWILAFVFSYLFAMWALSTKTPTRQDALVLIAVWLFVTFTGFLGYGILLSDRGPWVVVAPEILVQFAIEVVAIFLAAHAARRKKIDNLLGEGMI